MATSQSSVCGVPRAEGRPEAKAFLPVMRVVDDRAARSRHGRFQTDFPVRARASSASLEKRDAGVEVGQFAQPRGGGVVAEGGVGEDFRIGPEGDGGAPNAGSVGRDLAHLVKRGRYATLLEPDRVDLAVAIHLGVEILAERVDTGDADARAAARYLVGRAFLLELAAGVKAW